MTSFRIFFLNYFSYFNSVIIEFTPFVGCVFCLNPVIFLCFQAWRHHRRGSWFWWPTPTCTGTLSTRTSSWSKPWCFCRSWKASLRGPRAPWRPARRPPTRPPSPSSCVLTSTRCPTPVSLSHLTGTSGNIYFLGFFFMNFPIQS